TGHFSAAAIERLARQLRWLIEQLLRAPDGRLGDLRIPDDAEIALAAIEWNRTAEPPGAAGVEPDEAAETIHALVAARAAAHPAATAIVDGDRRTSFAQLARRSRRLAHALRALGVGPGDRVAVGLARSAALVETALALFELGAAYLPIDLGHPPA